MAQYNRCNLNYCDIKGDIMEKEKTVQITFRTTQSEKEIIVEKAKNKGLSTNEYIKEKVLSADIIEMSKIDISDDVTAKVELEQLHKDMLDHYVSKVAFDSLSNQLEQKDIQIDQLHKIIYNKDTKLLENSSKKTWWKIWK